MRCHGLSRGLSLLSLWMVLHVCRVGVAVAMDATPNETRPMSAAVEVVMDAAVDSTLEPYAFLDPNASIVNADAALHSRQTALMVPIRSIPPWALVWIERIQRGQHVWSLWIVPGYTLAVVCYLLVACYRLRMRQALGGRLGTTTLRPHSRWNRSTRTDAPVAAVSPVVLPVPPNTSPTVIATTSHSNHPPQQQQQQQPQPQQQQQPIDLTGSYQLVSSTNVDAFLAAQGVPWALRRMATAAVPIHHVVHTGTTLHIQIVAPGFTTQTTYQINGPPVETVVRGRLFCDSIRYWYGTDATSTSTTSDIDNATDATDATDTTPQVQGIVTEKRAVEQGYVVTVIRRLSADRMTIHLSSTVTFPDATQPTVESSQVFRRL